VFAVIDCGTTNSRVYIIGPGDRIVSQRSAKVGVRDVAVAGSNQVLKDGLRQVLLEAAENVPVPPSQLEFAIASGMITSEVGLLELPHLTAPAGVDDLVTSACRVRDEKVFPLDIPVIFVRGVKNDAGRAPSLQDLRGLDFMRGEEVQIVGLMSRLGPQLPVNIVFLTSHTKLIHVDGRGRIAGSITTISGQIYEALNQTVVASSLVRRGPESAAVLNPEELIEIAYEGVQAGGFLRTLLMPRFMQTLMVSSVEQRLLFVDAAIAADDMRAFDEFTRLGFPADVGCILIGHSARCEVYAALLRRKFGQGFRTQSISQPETISSLTVAGAIEIARRLNARPTPSGPRPDGGTHV
jgi:2-dehydro-3-deoxygalactonokinase